MASYFSSIRSLFPGSISGDVQYPPAPLRQIVIDDSSDEEAGHVAIPMQETEQEAEEIGRLTDGVRNLSLEEKASSLSAPNLDDLENDLIIEMAGFTLEDKDGYHQLPSRDDTRIDMMGVYDKYETGSLPPAFGEDPTPLVEYLASAIRTAVAFVNRDTILPDELSDLIRSHAVTKPAVFLGAAGLDVGSVFAFDDEHKSKTVSNILKKLVVRLGRPLLSDKALFIRLALYILATGAGYGLHPAIGAAFKVAGYADLGKTLGKHVYTIITGFVQRSIFMDFGAWLTRSRKAAQQEAADEDDSEDEGPSKPVPYFASRDSRFGNVERAFEKKLDPFLDYLQDERGIPHERTGKIAKGAIVGSAVASQAFASGSFFAVTSLKALQKEGKRVLLEQPKVLHLGGHVAVNAGALLLDTTMQLPISLYDVVSGPSASIMTVAVKKEMKDKLNHVPLLTPTQLPKIKGEKDLQKIAKQLIFLSKSLNDKELKTLAHRLKEIVADRALQTKPLAQAVNEVQGEEEKKEAAKKLADVSEIYDTQIATIVGQMTEIYEAKQKEIEPELDSFPALAQRLSALAGSLDIKELPRGFDIRDLIKRLSPISNILSQRELGKDADIPALEEEVNSLTESLKDEDVPERAQLEARLAKVTNLYTLLVNIHNLTDCLNGFDASILNKTVPPQKQLDSFREGWEGTMKYLADLHIFRPADLENTAQQAKPILYYLELRALIDELNAISETVKEKTVPERKGLEALKDRLEGIIKLLEEQKVLVPQDFKELAARLKPLLYFSEVTHELPGKVKHLEAVLASFKKNEKMQRIKKVAIVSGSAILATLMNSIAPGSSGAQTSTDVFTGSLKPALNHIKPMLRYISLPILVAAGYVVEHFIPIPLGTILGGVAANTAVTDLTTWVNVKKQKKADKAKKEEDSEFAALKGPSPISFEEFTELRNFVFEGIRRVLEKPWDEAERFDSFMRDRFDSEPSAVLARDEMDMLYQTLKAALLPQITEVIEPAVVQISPETLKKAPSALDVSRLGVKAKSLVEKWSGEFLDFKAAYETYGRNPFASFSMYVNGEYLDFNEMYRKEFPDIQMFGSDFSVKTAFICEAIFERAKALAPRMDSSRMKKAIAETVLVGSLGINPIYRNSHILGSFAHFDEENGYFMKTKSNPVYRITISPKDKDDLVDDIAIELELSQAFCLVDQKDQEQKIYPTHTYTSKISKGFYDPESAWKGTLSKTLA